MELQCNKSNSLEEYNFDYGFDISKDDFKEIEDNQKGDLFKEKTPIFSKVFYYVVFKNGKVFFGDTMSKYSNSFYVGNYDGNMKSGLFIVDKEENRNSVKKGYTIILENEQNYGVGLFSLIKDVEKCNEIIETIKEYKQSLRNKHNVNVWSNEDLISSNYKYDYENMTKEEIVEEIITRVKNEVDKKCEEEVDEQKKEKEEQLKEEEQNKKLLSDKIYEWVKEDKSCKIILDRNDLSITYYSPLDKPKIKFKLKSNEVIDTITMYDLRSFITRNKCKTLAEREVSFVYQEYNETDKEFEDTISIDFEKETFNDVKVAKGKMMFFINRVADYYGNKDISRYRNKEYVTNLNRLSGIKVDVSSLDEITIYANGTNYKIPIFISMVDRETFSVEIFNETNNAKWKYLKEALTSGCDVLNSINKGNFIRLVKDLGISEENIKLNLDRVKMLHKLKGDEVKEE